MAPPIHPNVLGILTSADPQKTARESDTQQDERVQGLFKKGVIKDPRDPHRPAPADVVSALPHSIAAAASPDVVVPAAIAAEIEPEIANLVQEILTADASRDEAAAQRAVNQIVESYSDRFQLMRNFLDNLSLAHISTRISANPAVISRIRERAYSKAIERMITAIADQEDVMGHGKEDLRVFLTDLLQKSYPTENVTRDFAQALSSHPRRRHAETIGVSRALREVEEAASCCLIL